MSSKSVGVHTVSTTPPRVNLAALPSPAAKTKKREGRTHANVITVPSHTKKDNPKAALKPRPRRQ